MKCPHCHEPLNVVIEAPLTILDDARLERDLRLAAEYRGFSIKSLRGTRQTANVSTARQIIYAALRARKHSTVKIGRALNRDHSTVISGSEIANKEHPIAVQSTVYHIEYVAGVV